MARLSLEEKTALITAAGYDFKKLYGAGRSKISIAKELALKVDSLSLRQIEKTLDLLLPDQSKSYLYEVRPELEGNYLKTNKLDFSSLTVGMSTPLAWRCERGHTFSQSVRRMLSCDQPCSFCSHQKVLAGWNDLESQNPELCEELSDKHLGETLHMRSNSKVGWVCRACSLTWSATVYSRSRGSGCPNCSKLSGFEAATLAVLKELYAGEIVVNSYPLRDESGKRLQLDLWLPELQLGFEIQDFATHSRLSDLEKLENPWLFYAQTRGASIYKKGPSYHGSKRAAVESQLNGVLVELWEDQMESAALRKSLEAAIAKRGGVPC